LFFPSVIRDLPISDFRILPRHSLALSDDAGSDFPILDPHFRILPRQSLALSDDAGSNCRILPRQSIALSDDAGSHFRIQPPIICLLPAIY